MIFFNSFLFQKKLERIKIINIIHITNEHTIKIFVVISKFSIKLPISSSHFIKKFLFGEFNN